MTPDELAAALTEEWCNGCGQPRRYWGPICGGMTQGDYTHYHSPEWWQHRAGNRAHITPARDAGRPDLTVGRASVTGRPRPEASR